MTRDGGAQPLTQVTPTIPTQMQCIPPQGDGGPWRHLWLAAPADCVTNTEARACIALHCKTGQMIWAEGLPVKIAAVSKPKTQTRAPVLV